MRKFVAVVALLAITGLIHAAAQDNEPYAAPQIFAKYVSTGRRASLSDFAGKPVIIHFWNPYCFASALQARSLQKFADDHPEIAVIAVSNPDYTKSEIKKFAKLHGWTIPLLIDDTEKIIDVLLDNGKKYTYSVGKTQSAFDEHMPLPTTFLINEEGLVSGHIVNYIDWQSTEMKDVVEQLLNGKLLWYYRYYRRKV